MVTVITKTIGPTGRDYTTFTLAEAAVESIATAEFGGTNLVTADGAIVFEADGGNFVEILNVDSTLVSDSTRNVTYRCADRSNRPVVGSGTTFTPIRMRDDYTHFDGIDALDSTGGCYKVFDSQVGLVIENCVVTSDGAGLNLAKSGANIGSAAAPCIVRNIVMKVRLGVQASGADVFVEVFNCTLLPGTTSPAGSVNFDFNATGSSACKLFNCLVLDARADRQFQATATVTGSNNIGVLGGVSVRLFSTNGVGSEATPTTSFSTPLGSGDFAVYMGSNGSLANVTGNDVWQQGVGPGSNASVPTTDINGVARSGASCNPGAFEADGFVAPTVITKTIDASGAGDYTTFQLALADLANVAGGSDLTLLNRAVTFEAVAGSYAGAITVDGTSFEFDPTRNLALRPQAGSEHGGDRNAGVIVAGGGNYAFQLPCDFVRLEGFVCTFTGNYGVLLQGSFDGVTCDKLIVDDLNSATMAIRNDGAGASAAFPHVVKNCVVFVQGSRGIGFFGSGSYHARVVNCTVVHSALEWCYIVYNPSATIEFTNNLALTSTAATFRDNSGTATITGSNNFGGSTDPFPAALQGSPYPVTASTAYDPGAGDFALYVGKNGALLDSPNNDVIGGGVGPASNSNVPTTDILGDTRSGTTTNPGAFALAQATTVLTKTIGPVGRDYATFTAAEADVQNIGGSADLVFENEAIEFLADAGTYVQGVNVSSSLTTDATRQVTYKPAAGSEHGGDFSAGVRVVFNTAGSGCFDISDDFTHVVGLVCTTATGAVGNRGLIQANADGLLVDGCILQVEHSTPWCLWSNQGGASATNVYQNNVLRNPNQRPIALYSIAAPTSHKFINNTIEGHGDRAIFYQVLGNSMTVEAVNNFIFNVNNWAQGNSSGGATFTTTGSNNIIDVVGSNMGAGVVVLVCTATTNTTPGFGDYAIYEPGTGALVVVADNAALGGGVGPAANADVPVLDINGVQRIGGGCDPGAFEGVRSRSLDVWDVVTATHNTPGTFGEMMQQVYLLTRTAAAGRIV